PSLDADAIVILDLGLGVLALGLDLPQDPAVLVDEEPAVGVRGILGHNTAEDHLGPAEEHEVAGDVAKDMNAAAEVDDQVAGDIAADVHLAPLEHLEVAGDAAPECKGLGDDCIAMNPASLFPHLLTDPVETFATGCSGKGYPSAQDTAGSRVSSTLGRSSPSAWRMPRPLLPKTMNVSSRATTGQATNRAQP